MPHFLVSARGGPPSPVEAINWLSALGIAFAQMGVVARIDRLACEVLPNGTVIARDARTGTGYVVRPVGAETDHSGYQESDGQVTGDRPEDDGLEEPSSAMVFEAEEYESAEVVLEIEDDTARIDPALVDAVHHQTNVEEGPTDLCMRPAGLYPGPPSARPQGDADSGSSEQGAGAVSDYEGDENTDRIRSLDDVDEDPIVATLLLTIRQARTHAAAAETALDVVMNLVPCEAGSILIVEPNKQLRFAAVVGRHAALLRGVRLPAGTGIAGAAVERGVPLLVRSPARDPRFYGEVDKATGFTSRSMLCVPVRAGARVIGCVQLINPADGESFAGPHQHVVSQIADRLAERLALKS